MEAVPPVLELQIANTHALNPSEKQFQSWISHATQQLLKLSELMPLNNFGFLPIELCIRLVDQQEMQQLNRQFRDINKPTNVLAFPFEAPPGWLSNTQLLGDIVICSPVVASEAAEQLKPVEDHWAHITLHGFLHLLGYDHIEDADANLMEALEIQLLATHNIPNPYLPRETTLDYSLNS